MSFDGRVYPGASMIYPIAYHPNSPAIALVPSQALLISYLFSRTHARKIGDQTYRHYMQDLASYGVNGVSGNENPIHYVYSSGYMDVARFKARIPAHATHIEAECSFRVLALEAGTVRHRIVVTDGTNTDTGNDQDQEFEAPGTATAPAEHLGGTPTFEPQTFESFFDPGYTGRMTESLQVQLSNVRGSLPGELTITIQAYAFGESTGDTGYSADFYTAAWAAVG